MKDNNKTTVTTTSEGIGFTGALTIAFVVLKLCNVIDWSWVWVLSPLWISVALGIFFILLAVIISKFTD